MDYVTDEERLEEMIASELAVWARRRDPLGVENVRFLLVDFYRRRLMMLTEGPSAAFN
jgi:hypothetical protein